MRPTPHVLAGAALTVAFAIAGCTAQPANPNVTPSPAASFSPAPTFDPNASAEARQMLADALREGIRRAHEDGAKGGADDNYVAQFGNCPAAERLLPEELAASGVIDEAALGDEGIESNPIVRPFFEASGAPVACHVLGTPEASGIAGAELVVMPVEVDDPEAVAEDLVATAADATDPITGAPFFGAPSQILPIKAGDQEAIVVIGDHPEIAVGRHAVVVAWQVPSSAQESEDALIDFFVQLGNLEPRS